ncbi:DUF389 domain-containing protein [Frigoriflavimonas asaccharolytica]|uniref:Putative hydrophobic protein (TIGR00271 family) n=1 Tax=Frigoriflavimonas asaccharolytica TaxID=2735899 RepID=A0A8J8G7K8_9FLAO|nr:DUF389 domain-containing protein [Frigoriflavimonas asaccharolytica]NRS90974.1 putative hydrophobic protein (TIGR00271 family) [Frigoriflavimonas asaccharolytica]
MMERFVKKLDSVFNLFSQKENFEEVLDSIKASVPFKGTNLWILIFAIFIASLGLNINSTAVIIGAMLISPLMGPIIGVGFAVGVNHPALLKLSLKNYAFAFFVGLATSTIYFLISPLSEAHSEILARTSPNIYDVFIAFFGGAAGMLANGSKLKGNVIPGVAIATALMPPLCTAGYGLATGQYSYFFGATYLFLINTVYIALSTFLVVKVLNFSSYNFMKDEKLEKKSQVIMWVLVGLTLIPSIYFGYVMIKKNTFETNAKSFIANEAIFPNNFLLQKDVNFEESVITLTYGGQKLEKKDLELLKKQSSIYHLENVKLIVKQGFNFALPNSNNSDKAKLTTNEQPSVSTDNFAKVVAFQDSITKSQKLSAQVFKELKSQNPNISEFSISYVVVNTDSTSAKQKIIFVKTEDEMKSDDKEKLKNYLRLRTENDSAKVIIYKN